jgi:hypothetical protein
MRRRIIKRKKRRRKSRREKGRIKEEEKDRVCHVDELSGSLNSECMTHTPRPNPVLQE